MSSSIPPLFQDLISRMLEVNVSKRITINQIKEHPAFRFNLKDGYYVPKPISILSYTESIDIDDIDPTIFSLLLNIGYENEKEIAVELTSNEHSMAKVFYHMYNRRISLESLPWETESSSSVQGIPYEAFVQSPEINLNSGTFLRCDPFYRKRAFIDMSSPEILSLALKNSWIDPLKNEFEAKEVVQMDSSFDTPEDLFHVVQSILFVNGFDVLYPNQLQIIARRIDVNLYVIINLEFMKIDDEKRKLFLIISKSGKNCNEFEALLNDIESSIV